MILFTVIFLGVTYFKLGTSYVAATFSQVVRMASLRLSDVHNTVADIFSIDESKNHSQGPTFTVALILTVAAAFGLRICAHYSFNDYNNDPWNASNK